MTEYAICTFHKCGSNWFRDIFVRVAEINGDTFVHYPEGDSRFGKRIDRDGGTQHVFSIGNKREYDALFGDRAADIPTVLCLRDPKDAIVSQYFSWRNTHKNNTEMMLEWRDKLSSMSPRDGIQALIDAKRISYLNHLSRWESAINERENIYVLRYEDLLNDFGSALRPILKALKIEVSHEQMEELYLSTRFEAKVRRQPGEEDQTSHYRKGVAGDSKNYFDTELDGVFDNAYKSLAQAVGYTY